MLDILKILVKNLNRLIKENRNMKEIKEFDFWNDHSRNFLEMAFRTDRQIVLHNHPNTGMHKGGCGDMVEIYLDIDSSNMIKNISYNIEGCINTNACTNAICSIAEGKHIDEAWEITPERVIDFLETLPVENHHCAKLAVGALYKALSTIKTGQKK